MEKLYSSITHGKLTEQQVFEQIKSDIKKQPYIDFEIIVGTDSQTYDKMRVVPVIALMKIGKGGKWFHMIEMTDRKHSIREKIYHETQRSLDIAKRLTTFFYDNHMDFTAIIAVDMGENKKGKTHSLIKEIAGWVTSEGFECRWKPNAGVASTIADRISK